MEQETKETGIIGYIGITLMVFVACAFIFEIVLFVFAYTHADEVECNLLWCTFKTTRQISSRECYINGVQVNCTDFSGDEHFCNDGRCEMNGVCPGANDNRTIEDCINEVVEGFEKSK